MMTDPVADMLTRLRNALANKSEHVRIPNSKLKVRVAEVLQREGYIAGFQEFPSTPKDGMGPQGWIEVELKYGLEGEQVIQHIERISKPGCRIYQGSKSFKPVRNGLGIQILSTSRGVLSDREAKRQNVGGEVLALVY